MSFAAKYDGSCNATACHYDGRIRAGDMVTYNDDEIMHVTCAKTDELPTCPTCFTQHRGEC